MASLEKRKQLVQELRKAHFPFGFEANQAVQSEYIEKYKQHQIPTGNHNIGKKPTNVQISHGSENHYLSQFQQKFPQHPLPNRQKHKPNQTNNIVLGYSTNSNISNYNDHFLNHPPQPPKQRLQPHTKPNIQLGDALSDFATSYNANHNHKELPQANQTGMDIRKTNMVLGNDATHYITQNNSTYQGNPGLNAPPVTKDYGSNILLGSGNNAFSTENKQNYLHKQVSYQQVDKDLIKDFKSKHFHFGFPNNTQHQSEAQAQYSQKPIPYTKSINNLKPNIDLKLDDNTYYDTTYGKQFDGKQGEKRGLLGKSGEINSVMLGAYNDPNLYQSQARGQFNHKPTDGAKQKLVKHPNNLELGTYSQQLKSHYQAIHQDKFNQLQKNKLSQEQILKLKAKNFVTGFQNPKYQLSSQNYGQNQPKQQKNTFEIPKSANIIGETNNPVGNSIYKSSFSWKKNDQF